MMRGARRSLSGFTLVEVLVTLLIMSMVMVSITQILTAARTSRDTIHNIQETHLAGPAIMDLIERDLRALVTYNRGREGYLRVKNRVLSGLDADSIDFACTTNGLVPAEIDNRYVRGDINEVGYHLRANPDDDDFLELYRREGFGVDGDPFKDGQYTFLHDRVRAFDVLVYEEDGEDVDPLEDWGSDLREDRHGLPRRVEIQLTLEISPRLSREQLEVAPVDRRTFTFRRVFRMPASLLAASDVSPVPLVPNMKLGKTDQEANQSGGQ
jgi:prepilin-type N-terminal cleavage/methylation domain-containing protein